MSDAPRKSLPIRAACQILAITAGQYYDWRKMKLLGDHPGSSRVSSHEAMQLAVLGLLCSRIGGKFGRMAYRQIQQEVAATIGTTFEIVWVEHSRSAVVVRSDPELLAALKVEYPLLIIRPHEQLVRLSRVWDLELEERNLNLGAVKRGRQSSTSRSLDQGT
jgi:hypothetical protein